MTPLLGRALAERTPAILRQAVVIINNMCKLVDDPRDARQFLPILLPAVTRIVEIAADPELRETAARARATLVRVGGGEDVVEYPDLEHVDVIAEKVQSVVHEIKKTNSVSPTILKHIANLICSLNYNFNFEPESWKTAISQYLSFSVGEVSADKISTDLSQFYFFLDEKRRKQTLDVEEDEGEELCNCEFSLAYGYFLFNLKWYDFVEQCTNEVN